MVAERNRNMKQVDILKKQAAEKLNITIQQVEKLAYIFRNQDTLLTEKESIRKVMGKPIEIISLKEAAESQVESVKMPIGMEQLDTAMEGGIALGSSIVLAAPSGEGKTAFMVSLSYHFLKQGCPCLWFSFEENVRDIWERFKLTGIEETVPAFVPLDLEDNKLNFIEDVILKFKLKHEMFVVFIDQLSFLAPKITDNSDIDHIQGNYAMYLGQISQQIKNIAMEQQIIIVVAHQLGRTGDVAYSDMIKHAPDKVIYLKREPDTSPQATEEFTDKTFVIFKKNRPYGSRPKLIMTVKDGLFVKYGDGNLLNYAKELMHSKKTNQFNFD
jgi:predicted ATP-dependent serine protease